MPKPANSVPVIVWILIFLLLFLGLNALVAGGTFIIAPDGHLIQMPMSNLENSPFTNFRIPGILLCVFIGIYPIMVAYSLWKRPSWKWPNVLNPFKRIHWCWAGSLAAGMALIVWIVVQIQWIQFGLLHLICLIWGGLIVAITLLPTVRQHYSL